MRNGKIGIIDDNEGILKTLRIILSREFKEVVTSTTPAVLSLWLKNNDVDVIVLDMNFVAGTNTGNEGLFWMHKIRETNPALPVVLITAYGDVELAVKALKQGASDFIVKPWNNEKLIATLVTAWEVGQERKKKGNELLGPDLYAAGQINPAFSIIGQHPLMLQMLELIDKVAATTANVLITGENGTGKELVAQLIHARSARAANTLTRVDLGAVAETLFESEMFGYVKGAFTDAREHRAGKFESAHGSTLFLDEIGNLSLPLQAKLLAALENREIYRIGSNHPVSLDIRLLCATNQHLNQAVAGGTFREDLLYRINTIHIGVPPLRSRGDDLFLLLDYFLQKYARMYGKPKPDVTSQAKEKLASYLWPGNVRELQHCVERAVILCDSPVLQASHFYLGTEAFQATRPTTLDEMEKQFIAETLIANKGNLTTCAQQLSISRQTLYNKMRKYNL